jgi:hypothetical protein
MIMKLKPFHLKTSDGQPDGIDYYFYCPGCDALHCFRTNNSRGPNWEFDGEMEIPTVKPSLLVQGEIRCHLFITIGKLQFLDDCEHKLVGHVVEIPDIPDKLIHHFDDEEND